MRICDPLDQTQCISYERHSFGVFNKNILFERVSVDLSIIKYIFFKLLLHIWQKNNNDFIIIFNYCCIKHLIRKLRQATGFGSWCWCSKSGNITHISLHFYEAKIAVRGSYY